MKKSIKYRTPGLIQEDVIRYFKQANIPYEFYRTYLKYVHDLDIVYNTRYPVTPRIPIRIIERALFMVLDYGVLKQDTEVSDEFADFYTRIFKYQPGFISYDNLFKKITDYYIREAKRGSKKLNHDIDNFILDVTSGDLTTALYYKFALDGKMPSRVPPGVLEKIRHIGLLSIIEGLEDCYQYKKYVPKIEHLKDYSLDLLYNYRFRRFCIAYPNSGLAKRLQNITIFLKGEVAKIYSLIKASDDGIVDEYDDFIASELNNLRLIIEMIQDVYGFYQPNDNFQINILNETLN